jgi:hypothetical protein
LFAFFTSSGLSSFGDMLTAEIFVLCLLSNYYVCLGTIRQAADVPEERQAVALRELPETGRAGNERIEITFK